jgi:hypothetical protein
MPRIKEPVTAPLMFCSAKWLFIEQAVHRENSLWSKQFMEQTVYGANIQQSNSP